jgi:L-iditol 2-dehydrogenase
MRNHQGIIYDLWIRFTGLKAQMSLQSHYIAIFKNVNDNGIDNMTIFEHIFDSKIFGQKNHPPMNPLSIGFYVSYNENARTSIYRLENRMITVRLQAPGKLVAYNEPTPTPTPDESLLRITAVGICGSDLHWFNEAGIGDNHLDRPLILGHEFCARMEDGRRVAVDPAIPCGTCEHCLKGNPNLCPTVRFAGHNIDGALREWITWPTRLLFPIPDSMADTDGAMLEPLGVAIHAVDLGKIHTGMMVGVFGCGPIGILVAQLARLSGAAQVVVSEPLEHRLHAAQRYGAQIWDRKQNVDVAFECAGDPSAVDDAVQAIQPGGRVVLAGIPDDDRITFRASLIRRKGLTLKLVRRMKNTYPRAIRLVSSGMVDVHSLVTHQFPLTQTEIAFQTAARRDGLKVIVTP